MPQSQNPTDLSVDMTNSQQTTLHDNSTAPATISVPRLDTNHSISNIEFNDMLAIEVHFGKSRSDTIYVKFDDNPEELAKEFIKKNKLKAIALPVITERIMSTIQAFKKSSQEIRPQSPAKDEGMLEIKSSNSMGPSDLNISQLSAPQDPADLPPTPKIRSSSFFRNEENRIPLDIDTPVRTEQNPQVSQKPVVPSIDTLIRPSNSFERSPSRRMSDGYLLNSLRSLTKWSPMNTYRSSFDHSSEKSASRRASSQQDQTNDSEKNTLISGQELACSSGSENDDKLNLLSDAMSKEETALLGSVSDPAESNQSELLAREPSESSSVIETSILQPNTENIDNPKEDLPILQTDANDSDSSEDYNPEDTYNRLKQSFYNQTQSPTSSLRVSIKPQSNILSVNHSQSKPTMISRIEQLQAKQKSAKTAHDRLYYAACIAKERKEKAAKNKEDEASKELTVNQFKINKKSREYTSKNKRVNLSEGSMSLNRSNSKKNSPSNTPISLHDRIYMEAINNAKKKERIVQVNEELRRTIPSNDYWSCSRCGTVHEIKRPVILTLNNFSVREPDVSKICKQCSFDQSKQQEFKPMNIGLHYLSNDNKIKKSINERKQRLEQQASISIFGNKEEDALTIHDILYKNVQSIESKQMYRQAIVQVHDKENTFHPVIPETSNEVLRKKIQKEASSPISPDIHVASKESKLIDYFRQSPHERLYRTKHLRSDPFLEQVDGQVLNEEILKKHQLQLSKRSSSLKSSKGDMSVKSKEGVSKKLEGLVNRLTSEFEIRNQKLENATKEFYSKDPNTGQPLFQPKIGPPPPNSNLYDNDGLSVRKIHKNIFNDLHEEDKKKRIKQQSLEKHAEEDLKLYLKKHRAQALPESEAILQKSTQASIDELYRLLIATNTVVAYHRQYKLQATREELNLHICDESNILKEKENDINNWRSQALDLNQVNFAFLVPNIQKLVEEVRIEKDSSKPSIEPNEAQDLSAPDLSGVVDYEEFSKLVHQAMKRREGIGKWYVMPPKIRSDICAQHYNDQRATYTFAPTMNATSQTLAENRRMSSRIKGYQTHDILYHEAQEFENRRNLKKKDLLKEESEELTFKPALYRPPSTVQPKYRDPSNVQLAADLTELPMPPLGNEDPSSANNSPSRRSSSASSRRRYAEIKHINRRRKVMAYNAAQLDPSQEYDNRLRAASAGMISKNHSRIKPKEVIESQELDNRINKTSVPTSSLLTSEISPARFKRSSSAPKSTTSHSPGVFASPGGLHTTITVIKKPHSHRKSTGAIVDDNFNSNLSLNDSNSRQEMHRGTVNPPVLPYEKEHPLSKSLPTNVTTRHPSHHGSKVRRSLSKNDSTSTSNEFAKYWDSNEDEANLNESFVDTNPLHIQSPTVSTVAQIPLRDNELSSNGTQTRHSVDTLDNNIGKLSSGHSNRQNSLRSVSSTSSNRRASVPQKTKRDPVRQASNRSVATTSTESEKLSINTDQQPTSLERTSNRFSLSSMLTSLIHGDTPKGPNRKHHNLASPSDSPNQSTSPVRDLNSLGK